MGEKFETLSFVSGTKKKFSELIFQWKFSDDIYGPSDNKSFWDFLELSRWKFSHKQFT